MTTTRRAAKADSALAAAVDEARRALADEVAASQVGDHLGVQADDERVVTHFFAATMPGYVGWRWAVTIARAPRQRAVTLNEVVLLPGDDALLAPAWVPWKDRIAKGDLGPGDLVPVDDNDPRLVPGYLVGDEALDPQSAREIREVVREVGLGRERVLSVEGREEAAERWIDGDNGPEAPIAKAAPAPCATCGFMVRLGGPLSALFGVCANASSPSDGQVVAFRHGCGAHSDVRVETSTHQASYSRPFHDTMSSDAWGDSDVEPITP